MISKILATCVVIMVLTTLTSCKQKEEGYTIADTSQKLVSTKEDRQVRTIKPVADHDISLSIDVDESEEIPSSTLTLRVTNEKHSIKLRKDCQKLPKDEYAATQVPEEAVAACTCWWEASGADFYVIPEDGKAYFYRRLTNESKPKEAFEWKLLNAYLGYE